MWVLTDRWRPGYCDYHRHRGQVEIVVEGWVRLDEVDDAYVRPPRGIRRLLGYLVAYGPVQTFRKILSRLRERGRNRKFIAWGWGAVVATDPESRFRADERVVFLAPLHPACVNRVSLDEGLVRTASSRWRLPRGGSNVVLEGVAGTVPDDASPMAGWSRFSGEDLDRDRTDRTLSRLADAFAGDEPPQLRRREWTPEDGSRAWRRSGDGDAGTKAVVFGLGHYARNVMLPRISRHVEIGCIHEIDPLQLGPRRDRAVRYRTSAFPAPGERHAVYQIAGDHHTHAPIAIHALEQGADVVVEKPVVTTASQLDALVATMEASSGRLFAAFQRRYSPFNDDLAEDLGLAEDPGSAGPPVHCRCLVYEIPLPANHWYRWPNSRTRVVSNGCHWIDHFLHLNGFSEPVAVEGRVLANGDVVVISELENGASFNMSITEHGSGRLGVRDHVEFRVSDRTATITDQRSYSAESTAGFVRRRRIRAARPYDAMYRSIGRRLRSTGPGDSVRSVRVSAGLVLAADQQVARALEAC